jgi:hypothetical protein
LFAAGWRSAAEVAGGKPDELASLPGVNGVDGAKALIAAASKAAEVERVRAAEESARVAAAKEAAALAAGEAQPNSEAR